MAADPMTIFCDECGVSTFITEPGNLPPGWVVCPQADYLDTYRCNLCQKMHQNAGYTRDRGKVKLRSDGEWPK